MNTERGKTKMTTDQWIYINSIVRISAFSITGITIYLWLTKKIIIYIVAKRVIVTASLLTGVTTGLGYGWIFSILVTLLQTSVLYFVLVMANKEATTKRQSDEKQPEIKDRIL
ncbi:MAG: hypothetical protein H6Q72_1916 [Firmicutes bacterium]|nr:hypothetical protein [Bacillota bacterium]